MPASYDIRVDWNDDGDFSDTGENVTTRTLTSGGITIRYGRDQARSLSPVAAGEADLELDNTSRDYSPDNSSSPLAGNLLPHRPVRIQATLNAVTYGLHRGFLDEYELDPGPGLSTVQLTSVDALARLRGIKIYTDLYQGVTTGYAVQRVLDAMGWPVADRDIDYGATTIRWWWEDDNDAFEALTRLVNSEGPGAAAYVNPDGVFVFRDRHHRLTRSASLNVQATFRDTGAEPRFSAPLSYDLGWRDIINSVRISVEERDPAGDPEVVWQSDLTRAIADGETLTVSVVADEPFIVAIPPVAGTDYQLRSGAVTVSLSRTTGQSLAIFIKATGGPAVIDSLQLRARPVAVRRTVHIAAEDSTSIDRYSRRSYDLDARWAGVHDAEALAAIVLGHRSERLPIVSVRLAGGGDTRLTQQLSRAPSDRVHIVEAETGLDDDYFVEQIQHTIADQLTHATVFGCERVPDQVTSAFRFDVTGRGFNDGAFGRTGIDDPGVIFKFDTTGQGFNDGVFAT